MTKSCGFLLSVLLWLGLGTTAIHAQVTPDGTLSTTVTSTDNLNFTIENGNIAGTNLFHSFDEFSISTGGSAVFNNALEVESIFARITGGRVSNVDGLIQANGTAHLFLMNPAGMVFGPGAELNLGGSFFGTTAESIQFADGIEFSAIDPTAPPLLTVNLPVGLQLGSNPGEIMVQGSGHSLTTFDPIFAPYTRSTPDALLEVSSGNTLALIGGNIAVDGGVLAAESGRIELAAIALSSSSPLVTLNETDQGWGVDAIALDQLGDITLTQAALLDASSTGSIQVQGQNIALSDGSLALIQNTSATPAGDITLRTAGDLQLAGISQNGQIRSGLEQQTLGTGNSGDLRVRSADITMTGGASLFSRSFGAGMTGDIVVEAIGHVQASGFVAGTNANSIIGNLVFGAGGSGDINVTANQLTLIEAGNMTVATLGPGQGGSIDVNIATTTEIGGENSFTQTASVMAAATFGIGDSGTVNLTTNRLVLYDTGRVTTGGVATGNAGTVIVNAMESIDISGDRTEIDSSIEVLPAATREAFGLPDIPSGNAGNVTVITPLLRVNNQGQVSVRNGGDGNAGNLALIADQVVLNNQGAITANTVSGEGGNITLTLQGLLLMHNQSLINTESSGLGNGGNIIIDAPITVGYENSDIAANAVQGNGGNINITTQGLFGLEFRDQLTPDNDITASSQFGISGTVEINDFNTEPNSGLVELPTGLVDSSDQIAQGCVFNEDNTFTAIGRGGIPPAPTDLMESDRPWIDIRDLSAFFENGDSHQPPTPVTVDPNQDTALTEATTWHTNAKGHLELTTFHATPSGIPVHPTCATRI